MPSITTKQIFVTLSHSSVDNITGTKEFISHCKTFSRHLIIKELGKDKVHPHYHIYLQYLKPVRANNLTAQYKKKYFTNLTPTEDKIFLKVKAAIELNKLLGFYFQKEKDYEIVSKKDVDLKHYKSEWDKQKPSTIQTKFKFVSYTELPFFIINYIEDQNLIHTFVRPPLDKKVTAEDYFRKEFFKLWLYLFIEQKVNLHSYDNKKFTICEYVYQYFRFKSKSIV